MNLHKIIKETEELGITILFCKIPTVKGRYDITLGKPCIYVDQDLSDIEKVNVILHEKNHFLNDDINNSLSYISTYSYRIENQAEKNRIADFLSLINSEYPLTEDFNYLDYMEKAHIPAKYENFVKELATELYQENRKKTRKTFI